VVFISQHLNPVEYSVWRILQESVENTRHWTRRLTVTEHGVDQATAVTKLDHVVIAAAIRQWRRCLSACVKPDK